MARSERYNKNLSKVQDMLDGVNTRKLQVGTHNPKDIHASRKIGEVWTDSDGVQWEQKNGYRSKITKINVGMFNKVCKDCEKPCTTAYDKETFNRMTRCYHCQIHFEENLKAMPIGESGNKWQFWTRLYDLQNWIIGRNELEAWIYQNHEEKKMAFDESVANAMANANVSMEIKKNT